MNELFGVSMTTIAIVCLVITVAIFLFVGFIAVRNPVMFKMGLRNIPRRPAQSSLIVIGLMLSTLIITAAFGTGDTLTSSITAEVYDQLDEADELIVWDTERQPASADEQIVPVELLDDLRATFANDEDIEALIPVVEESLPVLNTRSGLNDASSTVTGYHMSDLEQFGGLSDLDGNPVQLSGNEFAINEDLADEIDAQVGDVIVGFYNGERVELNVVAIVPTTVFAGALDNFEPRGGTVAAEFLAEVTGKEAAYDGVLISNTGDARSGLERTDIVVEKLEAFLEGTPYQVVPAKQDALEMAEFFGNLFTTFFIVLGLFSIAAGVLLIFLIFVMLAAERKPEMGMARAVGAKRRQIVESFLAEGMGYDFGAAIVGLLAGIGVTYIMVAVVEAFGGEALGLTLAVSFTWRSLLVAFCIGIIATFIVIFIASWRASRLNIVAAIRDLPESKPINPEQATWFGLLRALLNAFAAVGFLVISIVLSLRFPAVAGIASLGILLGLVGPFIYLLRGSNFGAPRHERNEGERIPLWPFFTILLVPFYGIALLLVRFTRDRKPKSMPALLILAGIFIMPLGMVVAALQNRRTPIAWSIGLGTMAAVISVLLVQWGLDADAAFPFLLGVSLIVLWVALLLRYFQVAERLAFTASSLFILVLWYVPSAWTENLVGPLEGDIEMFFLSGLVMITAATFVIVYNADIVLPLIARLGDRFSRIVPAIKTGVAYPLTSRFRTGMTMAMIGLIMFALVMISATNTNFAAIFLNDDTKGGFDVVVYTNPNNPIPDIEAAAQQAGVDTSAIEGTGEVRVAFSYETLVSNIEGKGEVDPETGEPPEFLRSAVLGVDQGFIETNAIPLRVRADGFETDEDVWQELANNPDAVVLAAFHTVAPDPFAGGPSEDQFWVDRFDDEFEPFEFEVRGTSGEARTFTVIGQMNDAGSIFFAGMVVQKDVLLEIFPNSQSQQFFIDLQDGVDSLEFAQSLESGLLTASVDSLDKILDDQQSLQNGFLLVFQGFMGLGLIVGIAALGVVASRSVVERRQQIGMLRAIGYQRSMVALSFIFESSFIALSGILMGLILGLSLAWVLFTTGDIGEEAEGATFIVPWVQILVISAIAFVASMLMTFLPARAASRVAVAEALRYE